MNLEETSIKTTFELETSEKARDIIKEVSEQLGYRFQEMNSIAVAYDGPKEAVIKNGEKLEAYKQEAEDKINQIKGE